MREPKRLWGIDVIALVYLLGALLMASAYRFAADDFGRQFAVVLGSSCVVLAVGIFLRINVIRVVMRVLLGLSIAFDLFFAVYLLAGLEGFLPLPANIVPRRRLAYVWVRLPLAMTMFRYLGRDDVRRAFGCEVPPDVWFESS